MVISCSVEMVKHQLIFLGGLASYRSKFTSTDKEPFLLLLSTYQNPDGVYLSLCNTVRFSTVYEHNYAFVLQFELKDTLTFDCIIMYVMPDRESGFFHAW